MPIVGDDQSVFVHDRKGFLVDRTINTVIVELEPDEVFAVIKDLAASMEAGGPAYLVIESKVINAKDMD